MLAKIARLSGHELRNALNALVVNLEVVRSRSAGAPSEPFVEQSVQQAEESVRLAEAAVSLLDLVVSAVGPDGTVRCELVSSESVRIEPWGDAARAITALRALEERGALGVDTSDPAVILTIPGRTASSIKE